MTVNNTCSYSTTIGCWTIAGLCLLWLAGCDTVVGNMIGAANRYDDARESRRTDSISERSIASYQRLADAGDPKGLYYMAFVYAARHKDEKGGDAYTVKRMYEEAVAKGSNDAKVALGNMLVCGATGILWGAGCLGGLPKADRDTQRGLALLKEAAEHSCSVTEPLMALDDCRERETSIPRFIRLIYRDVDGGIPIDPEQEAYWRQRDNACTETIRKINQQRRCFQ